MCEVYLKNGTRKLSGFSCIYTIILHDLVTQCVLYIDNIIIDVKLYKEKHEPVQVLF